MRVRVASAGTGKTTSLVRWFLERIGEGAPLRRLAGVTFTRAAAAELRERVGAGLRELLREGTYLGGLVDLDPAARPRYEEALRELDGATLVTIHGFMALGLRLSAPALGLDPDFTTLPEWEAQATFEEELEGLLLLAREPGHPLHAAAARLGSRATPLALELFRRRSLAEAIEPGADDAAAADLAALWRPAYARYEARLGGSRLAPSEIELRALRLVRTPAALARLAARAPRIVVDEFQDVNPLQGRFFAALEAGGVEVEVVGDPKQSIYGFRQADVGVFRAALADGEALPPLRESRRHAQLPVRFLNALTRTLAKRGLGFAPGEAPAVEGAGAQAGVRGRIEVHWVRGDAPLDALRPREAALLAERLLAAHARGRAWREMAVLARGHRGLELVEAALRARGVPATLAQGRGFYERSEVRDLVHALRVGIEPRGLPLAAWLRGPFGGLEPAALDATLRAEDPLAHLERHHPDVAERLGRMRAAAAAAPLEALRDLVRAPVAGGGRFVEGLSPRARQNVDALLFTIAEGPAAGIEVLLERLDLLSRQAEEGDVPEAGEGVSLVTVHGSKGLEWPVTAVFDLGGGGAPSREPLHLADGRLHLPGGAGFAAARAEAAERARQESYRLLYVAASRVRDELILTGSVGGRGPQGWAQALAWAGVGPDARPREAEGFVLAVHAADALPAPAAAAPAVAPARPPAAAPWTPRRFAPGAFPPVESPSRVKRVGAAPEPFAPDDEEDGAGEPLRPRDPAEGERLPGQGVTVGTLLHDAIRRDADPTDPAEIELLRAQEVMFPYTREEQDRLLDEVRAMLGTYRRLLGAELPALAARERDLREWPVVLPDERQVWQGIIDRLYLADGTWYLDDYKTDRTLRPERYRFQLAVYRETVRRVLGVAPVTRLVGLRRGEVVPYADAELDEAWAARSGPALAP